MSEEDVILSTATSLFLQFEPGKDVYYLGKCTSLDEIPNPKGGVDPIPCRDGKGGFQIIGEKPSPPDMISFTIERLHNRTASWIDKTNCPFTIFALQRCEGNEGIFSNWITGQVVQNGRLTDDSVSNVSQRDAADEMMRSYEITARPPRIDLWEMLTSAKTNTEAQDGNCITSPLYSSCGAGCGEQASDPCDKFFIGTDAAGGVTADVLKSVDGGQTWTICATDPFAINLNITAIKSFMLDVDSIRVIAFRMTLAATPLQCSISDDSGTTWSAPINVGAVNAEAVGSPNALFIWNEDNIWVGTSGGKIYKSQDGGLSWAEQTSAGAAMGADQVNGIDFLSEKFGVAVGAGDSVIYTIDGGVNWAVATATGDGGVLNDVEVHTRSRWSVLTATGDHYMTYDGGVTWTRLNNFSGSGAGNAKSISFPEGQEMVGFMIHQTAGGVGRVFRTIDGGYSWVLVNPTTGSAGLNEVIACDRNHAFAVGDDDGAKVVIIEAGIL